MRADFNCTMTHEDLQSLRIVIVEDQPQRLQTLLSMRLSMHVEIYRGLIEHINGALCPSKQAIGPEPIVLVKATRGKTLTSVRANSEQGQTHLARCHSLSAHTHTKDSWNWMTASKSCMPKWASWRKWRRGKAQMTQGRRERERLNQVHVLWQKLPPCWATAPWAHGLKRQDGHLPPEPSVENYIFVCKCMITMWEGGKTRLLWGRTTLMHRWAATKPSPGHAS